MIGVGTRRPNTIQSRTGGGKSNDLDHDGKVSRITQLLYVGVAGDESGSKLEFMERYSNSAMLGVSFCLLDERE